MRNVNTKLKCLIMAMILLSGCKICLVCDGLSNPPCKAALAHVRPIIDSLYLRRYHSAKWGVDNCSRDSRTGEIRLVTITNPARCEQGMTLILDTAYTVTDVFYSKDKPYRH